jgi:hypothetical protein
VYDGDYEYDEYVPNGGAAPNGGPTKVETRNLNPVVFMYCTKKSMSLSCKVTYLYESL